jgi:hypothetical protein
MPLVRRFSTPPRFFQAVGDDAVDAQVEQAFDLAG